MKPDLVEPLKQPAVRVFLEEEVRHVDGKDLILEQVEVVVPAFAVEVGGVRVPARSDARVVGGVEDGFDVGREGGAGAVYFEADDLSVVARKITQLSQGTADLLQGLFDRDFLR